MSHQTHVRFSDIPALSHLAVEATLAITTLVAALHLAILSTPGQLYPGLASTPPYGIAQRFTQLIYRSISAVTWLVGRGINVLLAPLLARAGKAHSSMERENVLAALNGVLGDHLVRTANPLAIAMQLRRAGQPLELLAQLGHIVTLFCRLLLLGLALAIVLIQPSAIVVDDDTLQLGIGLFAELFGIGVIFNPSTG